MDVYLSTKFRLSVRCALRAMHIHLPECAVYVTKECLSEQNCTLTQNRRSNNKPLRSGLFLRREQLLFALYAPAIAA